MEEPIDIPAHPASVGQLQQHALWSRNPCASATEALARMVDSAALYACTRAFWSVIAAMPSRDDAMAMAVCTGQITPLGRSVCPGCEREVVKSGLFASRCGAGLRS